jgi:hypothetical protein
MKRILLILCLALIVIGVEAQPLASQPKVRKVIQAKTVILGDSMSWPIAIDDNYNIMIQVDFDTLVGTLDGTIRLQHRAMNSLRWVDFGTDMLTTVNQANKSVIFLLSDINQPIGDGLNIKYIRNTATVNRGAITIYLVEMRKSAYIINK